MPTELAATLSSVAGVLLSLLFQYVPGLAPWYEAKDSTFKALLMLICLVAATLLVYGASCYDIFNAVACSEQGVKGLIMAFVLALAANQSTHQLAKHF